MISRFIHGHVPTPRDVLDRRDMCIDAVAALDMEAIAVLVCSHRATVDDIQLAIAQTGHALDDIIDALATWSEGRWGNLPEAEAARLILTLTQPMLWSTS